MWELRLYVAGKTARSVAAFENLRRVCEEYGQVQDRSRGLAGPPAAGQGRPDRRHPHPGPQTARADPQDDRRPVQHGAHLGGLQLRLCPASRSAASSPPTTARFSKPCCVTARGRSRCGGPTARQCQSTLGSPPCRKAPIGSCLMVTDLTDFAALWLPEGSNSSAACRVRPIPALPHSRRDCNDDPNRMTDVPLKRCPTYLDVLRRKHDGGRTLHS